MSSIARIAMFGHKIRNESIPSKKKKRSLLYELARYTFIAFLLVLPVRLFLIQPFVVSGNSMVPTFTNGDYLVINELYLQQEKPQRGDVIVFHYPLDPSLYYIKRIVGLPLETVTVDNGAVSIDERDGTRQVFVVPHASIAPVDTLEPLITKLAADEYFVLGDNRDESSDSRDWGPLQSKFIVGSAVMRIWPFSRVGLLPGSVASSSVE